MNQTEIDKYLLDEMTPAEREKIEEAFLSDDEMFFDIAERENELVDSYIGDKLAGEELRRFEASLAANPARRQKIANSRVLHEFIADERPRETKTITIAERSGVFVKLGEFFRLPALQFASIGVILLLAFASVLLLVENRRLSSLETDLAAARQREAELSGQIQAADETASDLTADLNAERERIEKLEAQIANLGKPGSDNASPTGTFKPTIATLILSAGIRGGPALVHRLKLPAGVDRVSIVISITTVLASDERVSVHLNDAVVANNLRVRSRQGGDKTVSITLPVSRIRDGRNTVAVFDNSGARIDEYAFVVSKE